tara:strand:- start:460 stop:714 length:255 start_codon:yes stop_codon:yes gene_type:complete
MINKQLFNSGQAVQDGTDQATFDKMQDLSGASTLAMNPANPNPTPLGQQEGAQIDTALQTAQGQTTEVDPATGQAQTINKTYNT